MKGAGRYDQRIEVITFGNTPDGAGGTIPVEAVVLSTFARVKQVTDRQVDAVQQGEQTLPDLLEVGIRFRKGFEITNAMQVVYKGNRYQIANVSRAQERNVGEWKLLIKANVGNTIEGNYPSY
jgi:SPP1 family predicted phage head-tail adaptor